MAARHLKQNPDSHFWKLTFGALGVVYGDIGTSPLYAFKQSLLTADGVAPIGESVLGILSLIFWALTLIVTVKYTWYIMRADNHGEGGITSLVALLRSQNIKGRAAFTMLGLFGAGLLYGDGVITPAISVLSAVEGLEVATPAFAHFVVPITIAILVLLFVVQRKGTDLIGSAFGYITLIWFLTITATGLPWILKQPQVLSALNPFYGLKFLTTHGYQGFMVLGAVFLAVTGAEALYADMGHFGRKPIRFGWIALVGPALMVNYFGQGAYVLSVGSVGMSNPFYGLVSGWLLYPLVVISTLATVVASQALISGAFSLTQQTVQLGFLPRTVITHTSREKEGQIYAPRVNLYLMLACIGLVFTFKKSEALAEAYGIAVTGTMIITTVLFYGVTRYVWKWSAWKAGLIAGLFLIADLAFFASNIVKLTHGGWIPIAIALMIFVIMTTWKRGRIELQKQLAKVATPLEDFFVTLSKENPQRVRGTAIFMTLNRDIAPSVLLHYYKHAHSLHERVVLLSIVTEHSPDVPSVERVRVTDLAHGFVKVVARYGYMQTASVRDILKRCEAAGLQIDPETTSYYLGRETFLTTGTSGMSAWRKKLFVILSRNARPATEFFKLPADRVIEIGSQIVI